MARGAAVALLVAYTVTTCEARRAPGDNRPNLILFYPDTIRADALSTYGNPLVQTPAADALAAQGVLFEDAHVQHSQCSPSRCAMLSGRYMHVLGHRTQTHLLQPTEANTFSMLKAANYTTLLLGKNDVLSAAAFNSSFSYWQGDIGQSQGANPFPFGTAGYYSFAAQAGSADGNNSAANGDLKAVELVADWLASDPPEPFAIWLTGIGGHPPYGAPRDWQQRYSASAVEAALPLRPILPGKPGHISHPNGIASYRNLTTLNDTFFYELAAVYLGRVSYTDWILGQLVKALDASPLNDTTAVIFTSDHGDYSGSWPGLVEKYPGALEDVLTRVPLIARVPQGVGGGAAGLRVSAPVMAIDLLPTLLELAGVNATERHFGLSLAPFLRAGTDPSTVPTHPFVFSEAGYAPGTMEVEPLDPAQAGVYKNPSNLYYPRGREELETLDAVRAVMIRNGTAKMVYRPDPRSAPTATAGGRKLQGKGAGAANGGPPPPVSELYDLSQDPQELQNLWNEPSAAPLRAELLSALLDWFVETADVTPTMEDDRNLPPSPANPPFPWPPRRVV